MLTIIPNKQQKLQRLQGLSNSGKILQLFCVGAYIKTIKKSIHQVTFEATKSEQNIKTQDTPNSP